MENRSNRDNNLDKLDLKPAVDFVAEHVNIYKNGLANFLVNQTKEGIGLAKRVKFSGQIIGPQIGHDDVKSILSAMPASLAKLSKLQSVNYISGVPVPHYDADGNFMGTADWVNPDEFPRKEDHPSRILVGLSDGKNIYPTPIPETVSKNARAVGLYQAHVFLHEFFHTVEFSRRSTDRRNNVVFERGDIFTLEDFWNQFSELYAKQDRRFVSRYAATYSDKLNETTRENAPDKYEHALAEQMCESFVGYALGIISNDRGITDFRKGHPEEYMLMDRLCKARVVAKGAD